MATTKTNISEEIDEIQFPPFRLVQFGSTEREIGRELPGHNRNVSAIMKAGNYKVHSTSVTQTERDGEGGGKGVYYVYLITLVRE